MMNFFKRALLSVTRRMGKTSILFIIVFLLGNAIAGAISISQATTNVEKTVKNSLGARATLTVDDMAFMKEQENNPELKWPTPALDVIKKIGELPQVKFFDYSINASARSTEVKYWSANEDEGVMQWGEDGPYFNLTGVEHPTLLDVEEGTAKLLTEGGSRMFTEEDIKNGKAVAIISKQFADLNNFSVGSTMILKNKAMDYDELTSKEVVLGEQDVILEIIGIVEPKLLEKKKNNTMGFDESDWKNEQKVNTIYVPNKIAEQENLFAENLMREARPEYFENTEEGTHYEPIYILGDPGDVEAFKLAAEPLLPKFMKIYANSDDYDQIAGSMQSMKKFSQMVLVAAIVATVLILSLLVILFIRDRKHEFGIYLSLGERKLKVIMQVVIEVVMVAFIAMSLSLVTGNLLARTVSDTMIQNQLENKDQNGGGGVIMYSNMSSSSNMTEEEVAENYKIGFSASYILIFYAVGLSTVILSTAIPMIYILRLNPKKIMM